LLNVATDARLFHASDGTGFADLSIEGHRETWPLRSKRFQAWLRQQYYERTWDAPSPAALNAALNVLEAQAQLDGPQRHRPWTPKVVSSHQISNRPLIINRDDIAKRTRSILSHGGSLLLAWLRFATSSSARFGAASPTYLCERSCTSSTDITLCLPWPAPPRPPPGSH
jgi:hypothetical protein